MLPSPAVGGRVTGEILAQAPGSRKNGSRSSGSASGTHGVGLRPAKDNM